MFADVLHDIFPCTLLAIYATGLTPDASVANHTINRFFNTSTIAAAGPSVAKPTEKHKKTTTIKGFLTSPLNDDNTTWTCDRCQKPIPIEKVDEHTDYHYALDLDTRQVTPPPPKKRPKRSFFDPYSPLNP
jgi:DNA polymerase eta